MIAATDLKNGVTFLANGQPHQVIKYSLIKLGRGGAVVKLTARNLETGALTEKAFSSNVSLHEVNTYKRRLQFLYKDASSCVFMDPKTYDQVIIPLKALAGEAAFLKEGGDVDVLFWDEKALSLELPPKVILKVVEADPGLKGNSATNIYKPATLENGLTIKVPLFVNVGDSVKVDTRSGEYLERAK